MQTTAEKLEKSFMIAGFSSTNRQYGDFAIGWPATNLGRDTTNGNGANMRNQGNMCNELGISKEKTGSRSCKQRR